MKKPKAKESRREKLRKNVDASAQRGKGHVKRGLKKQLRKVRL